MTSRYFIGSGVGPLLRTIVLGFAWHPALFAQRDSAQVMKQVTVSASENQKNAFSAVPLQGLNQETLQDLNAESIGDAVKYFSGVLTKDYGGVGGLKTVSVRSLGAMNTGLLYDGIPVADAQSGQIDLSKFSTTFAHSVELAQAEPQRLLLPARAYSSASALSIYTDSYHTTNFSDKKWLAGFREGSFGLWQPFGGLYYPTGKQFVISVNAEAISSNGDYPYTVNNGMFSEKLDRSNSDIHSLQAELNLVKQFSDSSRWQTKCFFYDSRRGLPGSIIFFNNSSSQRLWDKDFFAQSQWEEHLGVSTALLLSAKFSLLQTRYKDPDFPNNAGGLDNHYVQQEPYFSAVMSHQFGHYITGSLASDIALAHLSANFPSFATPTRFSWWNCASVAYTIGGWHTEASLLHTTVRDHTVTGPAARDKNEWTPSLAASFQPTTAGPWLIRAFYKDIFRLPTFNDIYYNYTSSINAKLLPEFSHQYDIGATYLKHFAGALGQLSMAVDGYYNTVKDKIVSVPAQNLFIWSVLNLGKVRISGIDVSGSASGGFSLIKWSLRLAYTWQQALDVTAPASPEYKNAIPYTPNNSGSALLVFYYKKWTAGYSFLFSGSRYTLGQNNPANELPGWGQQDAFVRRFWQFGKLRMTVKAALDNLSNNRYQVVDYYPMPGRSYKINIVFFHA